MSERIEEGGFIVIRRSGKEKLSDHLEVKKDNWSVGSKKKLKESLKKKIRILYIGILQALDNEKTDGNIDYRTHKRLRSKVLNISNDQIRNVEMELDSRYNIEALNYRIEFRQPIEGGEVDK